MGLESKIMKEASKEFGKQFTSADALLETDLEKTNIDPVLKQNLIDLQREERHLRDLDWEDLKQDPEGKKTLDIEKFLSTEVDDLPNVTDSDKTHLRRIQRKLRKLLDLDTESLESKSTIRHELEETELDKVQEILKRPILIEEFLALPITTLKHLTP